MNDIINKILNSNNILICTHISPDGDAIGSALSLAGAIKDMGKIVDVVIPDFPSSFDYLKLSSMVVSSTNKQYDLGIAVDVSSINMINQRNNEFGNCKYKAVIDHHASNTLFGDINYVDSKASACCEVIYELLTKMNYSINIDIGEALLTGILTDTNGYLNNNVTTKTFDISSRLFSLGIDMHSIYYRLLVQVSRVGFELRKRVYDRLEFLEDGKIAFSYLTKQDIIDTGALSSDYEGLVEIGRAVEGVEVSVFIREVDEGYKVSIRTIQGVSAVDIALTFGGGGHLCASGCFINETKENTKKMLIQEIRKYLI